MKQKLGQHFFGRHRKMWGIWICDSVTENGSTGRFIKDVISFELALKEVYALNGWGEPKTISQSY